MESQSRKKPIESKCIIYSIDPLTIQIDIPELEQRIITSMMFRFNILETHVSVLCFEKKKLLKLHLLNTIEKGELHVVLSIYYLQPYKLVNGKRHFI